MSNATLAKFGDPETRLADYTHWRVLLRPAQPTLGSLILGAKSEARAFSALPGGAYAELGRATRDIETVLSDFVRYERINYLMLMMVDPHVHFHVIPRYQGKRDFLTLILADKGWPGPPDLASAVVLDGPQRAGLAEALRTRWDRLRAAE
ncbi:MAG: HIT family protein [Rhizobiales bacterium]|nr:HIT family protein [Hyphomicrobiales bacterium]